MNTSKVAELERLLSDAMHSVTVEGGGRTSGLGVPQYRQLLQACRSVYNPDRRHWVSSLQPEVRQRDVRGRLLAFVNRELGDYVRDGKIHSATIAFVGGLSSGAPIEDVLMNLLRRTIVDGPAEAARAFIDCTTGSSCNFYEFFLLSGVRIPEPFEVFDGVTLIPLPESPSALPPHLPYLRADTDRLHQLSIDDLFKKTLVRVEYEAHPVFHKPEASYTLQSGPDKHFTIKPRGGETPGLDLNILCQALAVAGRCNVESVMAWTSLLDYEIFDLSTTWGIGASGYSSAIPASGLDGSVELNSAQMGTIKTLYRGITEVPTEVWEKLRIPIDRWAKAMAEDNPLDQIIDLGISLESLYVPDAQGEVSLRFALHAAWHLGKTKTERRNLREEFRQIYAARSDVVHTGRLRGDRAKPSFDVSQFVARAQELCWQGITSVIAAGDIPRWDDLVMGQEAE